MKRRLNTGFTLVEVLVTIAVVGLVAGSIASMFITIQTIQHRATYNDQATRADQREIETLRNLGTSAIPLGTTDFSSSIPAGSLPPGATAVATVTTPVSYPDLRSVKAAITYTSGSATHVVILNALIGTIGTHAMTQRLTATGFTLVEALVSISVTAIMVVLIGSFMVQNIQQNAFASARSDLLRESESSLDFIANDVRLSTKVDDPNEVSDPSVGTPWHPSGSILLLATGAQDSDHNILFSDPANGITYKNNLLYFVQGGTLYKRVLANSVAGNAAVTTCPTSMATPSCPPDPELLHNVTAFSITYFDSSGAVAATPTAARSIELHVTASQTLYTKPVSVDYTTRMAFRND